MSVYTRPLPEDFDDIEVERLMNGDGKVPLYRHVPGSTSPLTAEAVEAVRRLASYGLSDRQVSERFNGRLSPGAVFKVRHRYGIPNSLTRRLVGAP